MTNRYVFCIVLICMSLVPAIAVAQTAQKNDDFDAAGKQQVVDTLLTAIGEMYLYPDRVPDIEKRLRQRLEEGAYKDATSRFSFAVQLTDDLRSMTSDLHFSVRHGSSGGLGGMRVLRSGRPGGAGGAPPAGGEGRVVRIGSGSRLEPDSPMFKMLHEQFRKSNFAMPRLEVLPGNIGYLRLDMMPPLDVAKPTLDAAMAFLTHTDALIIDLRDTPGGVGGFIPYFMSYFFAEGGKHLYTRHFGAEDRSDRYLTAAEIGGARRPDLPLYILTSSSTGSAAENLAFTLKYHGRATTVGETTVGGGHSAGMIPLGDGFTATIPIADVIHPETGKGFDGVGVPPTVPVAAAEALAKAQEMALETLLKHAAEPDKAVLAEALAELRAGDKSGAKTPPEDLERYTGQFGTRTIFVESGRLKYRREGGPALQLRSLGDDTFRLVAPQGVRSLLALPHVRFERDGDGTVKGFSLVRDGKVEEYAPRDKR